MNGLILNFSVSFVIKKGGAFYDEHGHFSTILQLLGMNQNRDVMLGSAD